MIIISSCTSSKSSVEKLSTEVINARKKVPGITSTQLREGNKIYIRDCSGCHALKDPYAYSAIQWEPILKRMFVKAKITDSTQQKLIADYVIAKSK